MFFIFTFYFSLLVLVILISLKMIERKRGKRVGHRLFSYWDETLHEYVSKSKEEYGNLKLRSALLVREDLPKQGIHLLSYLRKKLIEVYHKYSIPSRGTRVLNGNGKTSDYWGKIAEDKKKSNNTPPSTPE